MKKHPYLIFNLNNCLYGISTVYVKEVFTLPELTPIAQANSNIIGIINLRGNVLPVIDLNLRLGSQSSDYCLTDSIIVLSSKELRVGIIVNEVYDVKNISSQEISSEVTNEVEVETVEYPKIIAGMIRNTKDIFILSNLEDWFYPTEIQQLISVKNFIDNETTDNHQAEETQLNGSELLLARQPTFCPNATLEEKAIFRQRADELKFSVDNLDLKSLKKIAVVSLENHLFGVDIVMVREFTDIRKVTPIPCCPVHIIGNMNLRGEILTLVDLRELLNLPLTPISNSSKAMVIEFEGIVAGVILEEVYDAMFFLKPQEIRALPTATHSINDQYFQGSALYNGKIMNILDLSAIFLKGGLIVDEVI